TVCVVGKIRDLILQLSKSSIYSTKPTGTQKNKKKHIISSIRNNKDFYGVFFIFIRDKIHIMRKIQNIKPFFVKIKF
ncbi:hypothetical protein R9J45_00160, partial [Escherichia coli]